MLVFVLKLVVVSNDVILGYMVLFYAFRSRNLLIMRVLRV